MPIKSGQGTGVVAILASDTTLINNSAAGAGSKEVYFSYLHNTNDVGADITVELFLSDDATSAAAERIDYKTVTNQDTPPLSKIVVPEGDYLIGKASATGVNWHGASTLRTGADK